MHPKDRSLLCRMAGNIAGNMTYTHMTPEERAEVSTEAVEIAIGIIQRVEEVLKGMPTAQS